MGMMGLLERYCMWAEKHETGWMLITYGLSPCLGALTFWVLKQIL